MKPLRIKKGYVFAVVSSVIIGLLNGFKYTVFLEDEPVARDFKIAWINSGLLIFVLMIISLLLARWYYRLKEYKST